MDAMSDTELTKACADAEGIEVTLYKAGEPASMYSCWLTRDENGPWREYAPLHDDAQAMALVRKFRLDVEPCFEGDEGEWMVSQWIDNAGRRTGFVHDESLNRAICLCVARLPNLPDARGTEGA